MQSKCFPDAIERNRELQVMRNFPDDPGMIVRAAEIYKNPLNEETFLDPEATYTVGPIDRPPSYQQVEEYFEEKNSAAGSSVERAKKNRRKVSNESSIILSQEKANRVDNFIKIFSLELHCASRQDLTPDPDVDEIRGIFYSVHVDDRMIEECVLMVTRDDVEV